MSATVITIIICGALGSCVPYVLQLFLGSDFLVADTKPYSSPEMERNRRTLLSFEQFGLLLFVLPGSLYLLPDFLHSPYPVLLMIGMIGVTHFAAIIATVCQFGVSAAVSFIDYAANRLRLPRVAYLMFNSFLLILAIGSSIAVLRRMIMR